MNRTVSPNRRGGVPKGRSWTHSAFIYFRRGNKHTKQAAKRRWCLRRALRIIQAHSRSDTTRTEAARLLKVLEAPVSLRSGPLFRQDETAPGQAVAP